MIGNKSVDMRFLNSVLIGEFLSLGSESNPTLDNKNNTKNNFKI